MCEILLANNRGIALIDDEDWDRVSRHPWHAIKGRTTLYAGSDAPRPAGTPRRFLYMHRLVMDAPSGIQVDHINHNGLDNRRSNLRLATGFQQSGNTRGHAGTSKFRGVCWHKAGNKWTAQLKVGDQKYHLGSFESEEEAARVWDEAARNVWGDFAWQNFPAK